MTKAKQRRVVDGDDYFGAQAMRDSKRPKIVPVRVPADKLDNSHPRVTLSLDPLARWFAAPAIEAGDDPVTIASKYMRAQPPCRELERRTEFRFTLLNGLNRTPSYLGLDGYTCDIAWAVIETVDWQDMDEDAAKRIVDDLMADKQRQYLSGLIVQSEWRVVVERRLTLLQDVSCYFESAHLHQA